jgi:hypothetical protein
LTPIILKPEVKVILEGIKVDGAITVAEEGTLEGFVEGVLTAIIATVMQTPMPPLL